MPHGPVTVDQFDEEYRNTAESFGLKETSALEMCGVLVLEGIEENFSGSHDSAGNPWVPRKDQGFKHPLLILSGELEAAATGKGRGSINRVVGGNELNIGVEVGNEGSLAGAAVHQFGATIYPVVKKFLSWINSAGERVFAKSVTIPPRPYIGASPDTEAKCGDVIADEVLKELL